ncbi:MAG: zinc-ribbon domain-containing protein [Candidatus Lokiarchaeota archaeon]|nr:zinc-ribbon domain-containing protein [Candidatus Lokiarchaeota archaeon]
MINSCFNLIMSKQIQNQTNSIYNSHFCPSCGSEVVEGAKFCALCGSELDRYEPIVKNEEKQNNWKDWNKSHSQYKASVKKDQDVKYADFGVRLIAFIIDSIIINVFIWALTGFMGFATLDPFSITDSWRWALSLPYFWLGALNGQTIGKMAMNLKTVHQETFEQLTAKEAFLHVIGKVFFLPLDIILGWIAGDFQTEEREQFRITQRVSKSVVIKMDS